MPERFEALDRLIDDLANYELPEDLFDLLGTRNYVKRFISFSADKSFSPEQIKARFQRAFPCVKQQRKGIFMALTLFIIRGNNLAKILRNISDEFLAAFLPFRSFFSSCDVRMTQDTVTLARFAAAFPCESAKMADHSARSAVPELAVMPKIFTSTVYAAVSPHATDTIYRIADKLNIYYLVKFYIYVIVTGDDILKIVKKFIAAKLNPMVTDEKRKMIFNQLQLEAKIKDFVLNPNNSELITLIDNLHIIGYEDVNLRAWRHELQCAEPN